jgi:hypothetical protein
MNVVREPRGNHSDGAKLKWYASWADLCYKFNVVIKGMSLPKEELTNTEKREKTRKR